MASASFQTEMARLQDAKPKIKVEFIAPDSTTTDISAYFLAGATFEANKEFAPDKIQAGNFDVVLSNQDDKFSELVTTSLLYNINYHAAKIKVSLGFVLSDGTEEYESQAVGFIDQLTADDTRSVVTIRCRDGIRAILDAVLHSRPSEEIPVAGSGNFGNGFMSAVQTKPFATVTETWTITCTTAGGDGTAQFSVVGSVSGSIGPATSGTEFVSSARGIKFTITAGSVTWVLNDSFTFQTKKYPEWTGVNPVKIIWSILTGYNYDTNTQETWSSFVLNFDRTQSASNSDLNYVSFVTAISDVSLLIGSIKGRIPYDSSAVDILESILLLFLGSLFTDGSGKIKIQTFVPVFGGNAISAALSNTTQIRKLGYVRTVDEIYNAVVVRFKRSDNWAFSGSDESLDGIYSVEDSSSITLYKRLLYEADSPWYSSGGTHVQYFAQRIKARYASPPTTYDVTTGLDATLIEIGQYVSLTDTKYNLSATPGEVIGVKKLFDDNPKKIVLRVRKDADINTTWGFLGSTANEGDGESPQSSNYDSASTNDRRFCYLGQTGGGGGPDYRLF